MTLPDGQTVCRFPIGPLPRNHTV